MRNTNLCKLSQANIDPLHTHLEETEIPLSLPHVSTATTMTWTAGLIGPSADKHAKATMNNTSSTKIFANTENQKVITPLIYKDYKSIKAHIYVH